MENIYNYATVVNALKDLNSKGFTIDYNIHGEDIKNNPDNYEIKHIYRYEGDSNPDDEATVYGIESISGEKGVFVSGFSANSNNDVDKVLYNISIKGR